MSKVIEPATAILRAAPAIPRVPTEDEIVKPWGSVIHWQELFRAWVSQSSESSKVSRWLVPVTCRCGRRRNCYLTGVTGSEVLSVKNLSSKGEPFTGLCRPCASKLCRLGSKMPDGSELSLWEINEEGVPAVCGKCNRPQFIKFGVPGGLENLPDDFSWKCLSCDHNIGEEINRTGAKLFWLNYWLSRISSRPSPSKVPFACAENGCKNRGLVWPHAVRLKGDSPKKWRGLCANCRKDNTYLRDYTEDVHDVGPFKVSILYSRREGNRVPIPCPICRKENWFNIFRTTGAARNAVVEVCKTHKRAELRSQAQNGNGQMSVDANQLPESSAAETLIAEITPRIKEAKKLAREQLSKDWRKAVADKYQDLVSEVIEMLPSEKPSACALEQVARQHFGCSGSTLKRRMKTSRAAN